MKRVVGDGIHLKLQQLSSTKKYFKVYDQTSRGMTIDTSLFVHIRNYNILSITTCFYLHLIWTIRCARYGHWVLNRLTHTHIICYSRQSILETPTLGRLLI